MPLKTWKEEFYPVEANRVEGRLEAIQHSLTKWVGLRGDNLEKHELFIEDGSIVGEDGDLTISSRSCALCQLFDEYRCAKCPLVAVRGTPCDVVADMVEITSPYSSFVAWDDPEPMIELLERALKVEMKKC